MKGAAVAERTKKEELVELVRFTCLVGNRFTHVQAEGFTDADKKSKESILIIQGNAGDIGARHVPVEEVLGWNIDELEEQRRPEKGALCTITVGDPVKIVCATYWGEVKRGNYSFLIFTKNGIEFWAYSEETRFSSIDGEEL